MLQANGLLTPSDITFLLQDSARDMNNPYTAGFDIGFDYATGSGLIQADLAVGFASGGVIQNADQLLLVGTHLGDTLIGSAGNDTLSGGSGADSLDGSSGNDTADYSASSGAVNVSLVTRSGSGGDAAGDTLAHIENITGSAGDDTLRGNGVDNILIGNDGNDSFIAGAGDDLLNGGAGADTLDANGGNDTLIGGAGADILNGGAGIDTADYSASSSAVNVNLATGSGSGGDAAGDTLAHIENITGSAGDDTLRGNAAANILIGNDGNDSFIAGAGDDLLNGGAGADTLNANGGNDTLIGGAGADILNGGAGIDTADYSASSGAVNVNLATGNGSGGDAAGDTLSYIDNIIGSNGDDTFRGNAAANILIGNDGNDSFIAGAGDDLLNGSAGADTLDANGGNDTLIGGAGADILNGGAGIDTADYSASASAVNVNLLTGIGSGGDAAGDTLSSIENITGSAGDDTFTGNAGANILTGNGGSDLMTGGGGTDTFVFNQVSDSPLDSGRDQIVDFAQGVDLINVSNIDAFTFINTGSFNHVAGELRFDTSMVAGHTIVEGDVNGDGLADFQIELHTTVVLTAGDFVL